ncbi:MAG: hypothetical protein WDN66_03195 [Candidatus Saccharibacteria bacterium]
MVVNGFFVGVKVLKTVITLAKTESAFKTMKINLIDQTNFKSPMMLNSPYVQRSKIRRIKIYLTNTKLYEGVDMLEAIYNTLMSEPIFLYMSEKKIIMVTA